MSLTHGHARNGAATRIYVVWKNMHARCSSPNRRDYRYYGAIGIRVCARWASFERFLADMGEPGRGMTPERRNVRGNYAPGNCRWVTRAAQARNTRRNVWLRYRGQRRLLTDWARKIGLAHSVVAYRLSRGWPIARVLQPKEALR